MFKEKKYKIALNAYDTHLIIEALELSNDTENKMLAGKIARLWCQAEKRED